MTKAASVSVTASGKEDLGVCFEMLKVETDGIGVSSSGSVVFRIDGSFIGSAPIFGGSVGSEEI